MSELAEETGWSPDEIAKNIGMSYRWVTKYLPDELKDPEMKRRSEIAADKRSEDKRARGAGARRAPQKLSEATRRPEPPRVFLLNKDYQDTNRFLDGLENLSFCLRPGDQLTTKLMSWCRTEKVHWSTVIVEGLKLFFAAQDEKL